MMQMEPLETWPPTAAWIQIQTHALLVALSQQWHRDIQTIRCYDTDWMSE